MSMQIQRSSPYTIVALATLLFTWIWTSSSGTCHAQDKPNIVVIFTDDQGFGDLSCYGSQTVNTPNIDSLARDGTKFTSFYAQVVCGPSRSALLTGRYPCRSLGWSMPASETTIAELLRTAGYATGCVGKWDVSNRAAIADRVPLAQGFDYYWGPLGANDNGEVTIHHNNDVVETTKNMAELTRRYTDKSIEFIRQNKDRPFFLYLAHTMLHSVVDASPEFRGKSAGGLYGDAVEELDFHTGRLLGELAALGLSDNTLVIFTTDNGPWNNHQEVLRQKHGGQVAWGSSGPLREGKGSTYEGGIRVPCLVRWPGKVPAGRVSDAIFATIDFLPTFAKLGGCTKLGDRMLDGCDQQELLMGRSSVGARNDYFYFCMNELHAVRKGPWKLHLADRRQAYGYVKDKGSKGFELYNLQEDIGESSNVAEKHPEIVKELMLHATSVPWPDVKPDGTIALSAASGKKLDELKSGEWNAHGLSADSKAEIIRALENGVSEKIIPGGALLVMHRGEVILREARGVCEVESQRPFEVTTPCRIASITKPHTATLLVMLTEQGLLELDKPIDKYLPEFKNIHMRGSPAVRAPTLRECLSHTAGFQGNDTRRNNRREPSESLTLGDEVRRIASDGLIAQPGTSYAYSGQGYQVAGRVAEVVTGRSFQDLLRRYLIQPLGMETATFTLSEKLQPIAAAQYSRGPNGFETRREPTSASSIINPGGGLVSTLDDVARLMLLHRNLGRVANKQLVTTDALSAMYVAHPKSPGNGYGLGFNIVKRDDKGRAVRIRHTGASGTLALLDFDHDAIVVIFTQVEQTQIVQWRDRLLSCIQSALAEAQ